MVSWTYGCQPALPLLFQSLDLLFRSKCRFCINFFGPYPSKWFFSGKILRFCTFPGGRPTTGQASRNRSVYLIVLLFFCWQGCVHTFLHCPGCAVRVLPTTYIFMMLDCLTLICGCVSVYMVCGFVSCICLCHECGWGGGGGEAPNLRFLVIKYIFIKFANWYHLTQVFIYHPFYLPSHLIDWSIFNWIGQIIRQSAESISYIEVNTYYNYNYTIYFFYPMLRRPIDSYLSYNGYTPFLRL